MRGTVLLTGISLFILVFIPLQILQWIALSTLLLVLLSWVYSRLMQKHIWVDRAESQVVAYRHTKTETQLIVTNYLPLPVPTLLIADEPGALISDDRERQVIALSPGQRVRIAYHVKAHERGRYALGPITLQSSDPMGFFPWQRTITLPGIFLVFPRIFPLELLLQRGAPMGPLKIQNPLYEDPSRFRNIREYEPGDDPRRIQWKVSARSGQMQVAEYLATLSVPGIILLNLNPEDFKGRRAHLHLERAVEAAASAVHYWGELGEHVAFVTNGVTMAHTGEALDDTEAPPEQPSQEESQIPLLCIPSGKGRGQASHILSRLAILTRPAQGWPEGSRELFNQVLRLRPSPGTRIIYIGPSLDREEFSQSIAPFSHSWNIDLWILDEKISQPQRITGHDLLPGNRFRVFTITEFGEDVLND